MDLGASASESSSSLHYLLSIKLLRNCVWTIVNSEVFQTAGGAEGTKLDPALESILLGFGTSSSSPHRYLSLQATYCHTSENVTLHRKALDELQKYHLDCAIFTSAPSSEELDEGLTRTPVYNLELITRVMQLDLDLAFEREADVVEMSHHMHNTMHDGHSTSLVLHDGRVVAATHRSNIEELILNLKKINNSMLIADAELSLLQAWRTFVQICLQKQPALLGIKYKSSLSYEYVRQLAELLAEERRLGEGAVLDMYMQNVSSLFLAYLTHSLTGTGPGDLHSSILIHLSRRNTTSSQDESARGESVFRETNELIRNVMAAMSESVKVHGESTSGSNDASAAANALQPQSARAVPFDVMSRISSGPLAARVHSTAASSLANQRASPAVQQSQHLAAMTYMQNLITATLILTRWANQLLLQQFQRQNQEQLNAASSAADPLRSNPSAVRRLDGAFGSPAGKSSALAPVMESIQSVMTDQDATLIYAIGDEYADTCQQLMRIASSCVSTPRLSDLSLTMLPLLLQAIDIIQGATKMRGQGAERVEVTYEREPIDAALECIRPLLPFLLHAFSTMPANQPATGLKIIQLFGVIAQYEAGAEMLVQHSVVTHLCHHRVFNPPAHSGYHPSFSPYTPSGARDQWHQVWILTVRLVSTLLRTSASKSRPAGSISSSSSLGSPTLSASHTKLLEETLGFFNQFAPGRINKAMQLANVYQLSLGSLEEIDALTHLIYEFETYGSLWHRVNPALHATQRQQCLVLATYYMRLLNDHRELEKRLLIVSPEEKSDSQSAEDDADGSGTEGGAGGGKDANSQGAQGLVRNPSVFPPGGAAIERQKSDISSLMGGGAAGAGTAATDAAKIEAAKKSQWRPLGAPSTGLTSGPSTPRQLSTPTTPRSASTPMSGATPGPNEEKMNDVPKLSVNVMLTPVRGSSSFLLRSPVVGSLMSRRLQDSDRSGSGVDVDLRSSEPEAPQKGFAFFIQKVEFMMTLILRNCLSYIRLHSNPSSDDFTMRSILFSHKIKVVNIGGGGSAGFMGGFPGAFSSSATMQLLLSQNSSSSSSSSPSRTSLSHFFSNLGLALEEDGPNKSAVDAEVEQELYEQEGGREEEREGRGGRSRNGQRGEDRDAESQYVFRTPLSTLIDFAQYTTRVLTRLFEIQKSNGLLSSLTDDSARRPVKSDSSDEQALSSPSSLLPYSSQLLLMGAGSPGAEPTAPTIPHIHSTMQFLLEHVLYIFTQHVQVHVRQLKKLQIDYYLAQMPTHVQPPQQQMYYAYNAPPQPIEQPTAPVVPPGAIRISKLLDQYRERIAGLVDLLARYSQLLETNDPAPPSILPVNTSQPKLPRLIFYLLQVLEGLVQSIGQHQLAIRRSMASRTAEQQQQNAMQ
jgi:hypothetical protein